MNSQFEYLTLPTFNNKLDKNVFADFLSMWFNENGTLAFEHGYSKPRFGVNYNDIKIEYIDVNGLHGRSINGSECLISFERLTLSQMYRIVHIVNDYYLYCMYEA